MEITAHRLRKSYNGLQVVNNFSHQFRSGEIYGVSGPNGAGKSTLIKMLSGYLSPSGGNIQYQLDGNDLKRNEIYRYVSLAAPYSSIIQDFTLAENFQFLRKFKPLRKEYAYQELLEILSWKDPRDKLVKQFSSGMQQKVNILFAFICETQLLLLDEPTSFFDRDAKAWYKTILEQNKSNRTIVIASNEGSDFEAACEILSL
ncbi:MAG: ABC transporter ATP-binding protein [Saprospiraceae bacterium]|nr:ABC transporter ATP-binding protein [Saprospiraceae bacterium]